jgi:hypothetical protein
VIVSDEEIKAMEAQAAEQAEEPDPELLLKEREIEVKLEIARMNAQVEMAKIAAQTDSSMAQVEANMAKAQLTEDNKANIHMSELDYAKKNEGKGI